MIKISEPTQQDYDRGYQICPCGDGAHLLQSGFDVDMTMCQGCMREIADIDDFKAADALEVMSK